MKKLSVTGILCLTLNVAPALAGGGSSGGGGSFICKVTDPTTQAVTIISAESQDLWETRRKHTILESALDEKALAKSVLKKLRDSGAKRFESEVNKALQKVLLVRSIEDVTLIPLGDSNHYLENATCASGVPAFAAAGVYKDEDLVYSSQIFGKMDNISQAALNVHEAVYKVLRDEYRDTNSERARLIVGYLFSDMPVSDLKDKIPSDFYNPFSSKKQKENFQDLADLFNKGEVPRLTDLNQVGNVCYLITNNFKYNPDTPIELPVKFSEFSPYLSRKKKVRGFAGELSFGKELLAFSGTTSFSTQPYQRFFFRSLLPSNDDREVNPLVPRSNTWISTVRSQMDSDISELMEMQARKMKNGDLLFTETKEKKKCLESERRGLFGLSEVCLEYTRFNTLTEDPFYNVENFIYCPRK